jgi:hypothetical protein
MMTLIWPMLLSLWFLKTVGLVIEVAEDYLPMTDKPEGSQSKPTFDKERINETIVVWPVVGSFGGAHCSNSGTREKR